MKNRPFSKGTPFGISGGKIMIGNKRILFCNIGYLEHYDSTMDTKPIENGGAYTKKHKTGGEINNFHKYEDGKYYGFVEPGFKNSKQNMLHIEKIDGDYKHKDEISDVTVVFCARSTINQKTVIVGWYKNATVFRRVKEHNGVKYNITTNSSNAVRIPEDERTMKIPRANSGKFGFGESNLWYAKADDEKTKNFVNTVCNYIENWCEKIKKEPSYK